MPLTFSIKDGTYWLNLKYACGAVTFKDNKLIPSKSAPIFKKLKYIPRYAKFEKVKDVK